MLLIIKLWRVKVYGHQTHFTDAKFTSKRLIQDIYCRMALI